MRLSRRRIDRPEYSEAIFFFAHFGRICVCIRYLRGVKSVCPMSDFTSPQLAKLTRYSARQIQRFATEKGIPGAYRTSGGHWRFPDTPELRSWAAIQKKIRCAPPITPIRKRWARDNYVPHLSGLTSILLKTAPEMDEYELRAFVADSEMLYNFIGALRDQVASR